MPFLEWKINSRLLLDLVNVNFVNMVHLQYIWRVWKKGHSVYWEWYGKGLIIGMLMVTEREWIYSVWSEVVRMKCLWIGVNYGEMFMELNFANCPYDNCQFPLQKCKFNLSSNCDVMWSNKMSSKLVILQF